MKAKTWRVRYSHVPSDFPRRVRVLQALWDMTASEFGWRIGLNLDYIHRYRQGQAMPSLALCSKIEHAAGPQAIQYLMGHAPAPERPREPDGLRGPASFEKARLYEMSLRKRQ